MVISNISVEATQLARLNTEYAAYNRRLLKAIDIIKENSQPPEEYPLDKVDYIATTLTESNIDYTLHHLLPTLLDQVHPGDIDPATSNDIEPMYLSGGILGIMERNALLIFQLHMQIRAEMEASRSELQTLAYNKFRIRNPDYETREMTDPVVNKITNAIYVPVDEDMQRRVFNLHLSGIEFKVKSSFKTVYYPEYGTVEFFRAGLDGNPQVVAQW